MSRVLEDDVIRLRAMSLQDIDVYAALEDTPSEWVRSSPMPLLPVSRERRKAALEKQINDPPSNPMSILWAVELKQANRSEDLVELHAQLGQCIGFLSFFRFEELNRQVGLGIHIDPAHRGKGYAPRILELAKVYIFAVRGYNRIYLETLDDNFAMHKAAERVGFVKEGVLRSSWFVLVRCDFAMALIEQGKWHDRFAYGLLASEAKLVM